VGVLEVRKWTLSAIIIVILFLLAGCSGQVDQPGLDSELDQDPGGPEAGTDYGDEDDDGDPGFLALVYSETGDLWVSIGYNAPQQITSGHFDSYPLLSPDGSQVLFQRDAGLSPANLYRFELWVIGIDGSGERLLVSAEDLPGEMGYAMGEEEETMLDRLPMQIAWLDDSRRIAFNTLLEAGYGILSFYDLWIADSDTGEITLLLEDGAGGSFAYSPDGTKILVSDPGSVSIVNADGSDRRLLVSYPFVNTASEYAYNPQPAWAPDGSHGLVAIASEDPFFSDPYLTLWRLPLSGDAQELCTVPGMNLYNSMEDRLWNTARTSFAYIDDLFRLHIATLDGNSLQVYDNGDRFFGWSADDCCWIYRQAGEVMLDGVDLAAAPLELPTGDDNLDWFELKWVSALDYVALSGNYYEGMTLWTGRVGGDPRVIDTGVNSYDALLIN
jgi:hypothetical protein